MEKGPDRVGDAERWTETEGQRRRAARRRGPRSDFLLASGSWRVETG